MRHLELAVKRAPELLSAHLIDAKGERKHRKRKIQSERERGGERARMDVSLTCERTAI